MKRLVLGLSFVIVMLGGRGSGLAQTEAPPPPDPADPASPTPTPAPAPGADDRLRPRARSSQTAPGDKPGEAAQRTWQDVVVVPRKAFLKSGRLELFPFSRGVSLNDVLIRHYSFGGDLNYYLSDVFSIGLEGQYFVKERTDRESVVGLQYNRVATLNRYLYSGAFNFGYVPGYGKFTLFNTLHHPLGPLRPGRRRADPDGDHPAAWWATRRSRTTTSRPTWAWARTCSSATG